MPKYKTSKERFLDADGHYLPERTKIHKDIVEKILKAPATPGTNPESLLMGGGSGSGKSTIGGIYLEGFKQQGVPITVIDADEIKTLLPRYRQRAAINPVTVADYFHDESSDISELVLERCINEKRNFLYDGTMKNLPKYNNLIDRLKENGFSVRAIIIDVPLNIALKRVEERFLLTQRFISPQIVESTNITVPITFYFLKDKFDSYFIWDNSGDEKDARIFAQKHEGHVIHDDQRLKEFFAKAGITQ